MSNVTTLKTAEIFKNYIIEDCQLLPDIKARFSEMGLVKRKNVKFINKAPLGQPLEIIVRRYTLCIIANVAEHFIVRSLDE